MSVSLDSSRKISNQDVSRNYFHYPVMKEEVIEYLNPQNGEVFLVCNVGSGGHASDIIKRILPGGKLIGIDQDEESLLLAHKNLKDFEDDLILVKENFQNVIEVLNRINMARIDGVLFDLGISSFQLENPERGFGFKHDGPLDMRMDRNKEISAFDLINNLPLEELSKIIRVFGEERWHARIARAIVGARRQAPICTTKQLANLIEIAVPSGYRYRRLHPATKTFQAFRIVVNRELASLEKGLMHIIKFLDPGARICVISFHSLEDRIVKKLFKEYSNLKELKILTKKPLIPSIAEIEKNPRSRSAKFRVAEKI